MAANSKKGAEDDSGEFAEFQKALEHLQPEAEVKGKGPSGDFEGELNRSLDALFGPIGKR